MRNQVNEASGKLPELMDHKELPSQEQFQQAILDTLPAHIAVLDHQGVITRINESWRRFARENPAPGETLGEEIGAKLGVGANYLQVCRRAIAEGDSLAQKALEGIDAVLQAQRPDFTMEYPCHSPQVQRWFWMNVVRPPSQVGGAVITHLDISARKAAETAMAQARLEAEAANRAKDQFLAILSHELRTPLTPVLIAASHWSSQKNLPRELQDDLAMMQRNIELEVRMIDDLLDLSRILNGKLSLQRRRCDLHPLLEQVLTICRPEVIAQDLTLSADLQAAEHQVWADAPRLTQVIWNLLKNALQFTPRGGKILLKTTNPQPGLLELRIEDSGVGMTPEVLKGIFKAFDQGEASSQRLQGGLGLGLAIAKAIITAHQGQLEAQSPGPDLGTTFILRLALQETLEERLPRIFSSKRLLLVEDHADTAQILSRFLRLMGLEVRWAHSVQEALQWVQRESYDLLISDLGLPDGTGCELLKQIREHHEQRGQRELPAICMSGYGMESDVARSRATGFLEHLVKPINIAQLEGILQGLLGNSE